MTRDSSYTHGMGGPRKHGGAGGRYDMREIAARVDRLRRQRGMTAKELYVELGMEKWDWSRKVHNRGSAFTVEELGRIADLLNAPPGWPFLPDEFWEGRGLTHIVKPRH